MKGLLRPFFVGVAQGTILGVTAQFINDDTLKLAYIVCGSVLFGVMRSWRTDE